MDIKGSFKKSRSISSPPAVMPQESQSSSDLRHLIGTQKFNENTLLAAAAANENDELLIPVETSRNSALPPSTDVKGILNTSEMQGTTKVNKQESYKKILNTVFGKKFSQTLRTF
ncbi:uncharacterized protein LOC106463517 [Limulus polyphemus]|uniref:Uncharacterized protein LOC106463517 n=1 Tax=Limulus polyphemus TaxID=6850 RepID=A0ABM1SSZ2_LIMPO|nr:uncharacterized protein LOC106463517 [Limulus polyphemus]